MIASSDPDKAATSEAPDRDMFAVTTLLDDALTRGFPWLYFPKELECLFERETSAARVRHMILTGIVAIITYNSFLFADYTMVPSIFRAALALRLGIITPMALAVMLAQARGLAPWLRELLGATVTILGCVVLVVLLILSREPNATYYIYGIILTIMFSNIVLRLRFFYALATSLIIVAMYAGIIVGAHRVLPMIQTNNIIVLIATAVLTLLVNYTLERDLRRNYLLNLRDRIHHATLSAHNARLSQLAHIDPLTGLANRRELNDYLAQFQYGSRTARLAIILFDIDHFKLYNDRYGHPAGDECLRQVAAVLRNSLRQSTDMVARLGGEEFVIVMAEANMQTAHLVAERMRQAVLDLAVPHAASPTAGVVTVSGGVAVAHLDIDVQVILASADAALYHAKSAGRNCVQTAPPLGSDLQGAE